MLLDKSIVSPTESPTATSSMSDDTSFLAPKYDSLIVEIFALKSVSFEYSNETDFRAKISTIKESYFGAKKEVSSDIDDVAVGDSVGETIDLSKSMAAYTAAITKTKDIKLSK